MRRWTTILVLAATILSAPGLTLASEVVTTVRVFRLQDARVSIRVAAAAVQSLLSEHGTLTVQPHQSQLIVQDRPEVVERVSSLLDTLTRSRERYRIRAELLEASNTPLAAQDQAPIDARVQRMFRFTSFRRIGATLFEGEVGQSAVAHLGSGYQIGFVTNTLPTSETSPWSFADPGNRIHLDRVTLVHSRVDDRGVQRQTEVLRTSLVLGPGQRTIFGASATEGSDRALVLILEAQSAGEP